MGGGGMTADDLGAVVATLIGDAVLPVRTSVTLLDERLRDSRAQVARLTADLTAGRERLATLEEQQRHLRDQVLELEARQAAREPAPVR
jgi:hypothetical protein